MNWLCNGTIGIIAIINFAQFSIAQSQVSQIKDEFQKNFLINGTDKVTYSRNFNRHREFSYASYSGTRNEFCNVSLVVANSTNFSQKTCKFGMYSSDVTEIGVAALLLPDDIVPKRLVAVEWYTVGSYEDHLDSSLGFLNMTDCKSETSKFIGSISETVGNRATRVIIYHYPKIRTSTTMRKGLRLIRELEFGQPTQHGGKALENATYIRVNRSWMGEEQPVELGPSQGFFFIAHNNTPDSPIDVLYANLTTNATRVYGSIGSAVDTYPTTSGTYNSYGICWTILQSNNKVGCTQFLVRGQRSIDEITLEFPESVDWLAVHNLREPALLLVTGQCDDKGRCDRFKITKVHADGRKSTSLEIDNLNATCTERPQHLSMDVTEADSRKEICFHFVCLENKYQPQSSEKISTSLQYRRKCIDQGVIATMN